MTPSQFQVARAGIPRSPIPAADRSADTNPDAGGLGQSGPAQRRVLPCLGIGVIDLPDHEVAGPGMTPGEGVQARAEQHVIPPALG